MHARQTEHRERGSVGFVFDIHEIFSDKRLAPNRLAPKKSKQCDRQKGKADHVSQPSFS